MPKLLKDLPNDIYKLFDPEAEHEVSEENLELFAQGCKDLLRRRLAAQTTADKRPVRFSALGKPDRQVWMDAHPDPANEEKLLPKTYIKFLYGDLLEQLLLFLARESGHTVEACQEQVELEGVTGSIDCIIDGVLVDVKSASAYGFQKFANNDLGDDNFGYVKQLSGYADVLTPGKDAAWFAIDKVAGDLCVSPLKAATIAENKPAPRIAHLKEVVANEEAPPLCYQPVPDGASGNLKLPTPCSYCKHKFRCHPDLRVFAYAGGPRFLTRVAKEPNVPEIGVVNRKEFPDAAIQK